MTPTARSCKAPSGVGSVLNGHAAISTQRRENSRRMTLGASHHRRRSSADSSAASPHRAPSAPEVEFGPELDTLTVCDPYAALELLSDRFDAVRLPTPPKTACRRMIATARLVSLRPEILPDAESNCRMPFRTEPTPPGAFGSSVRWRHCTCPVEVFRRFIPGIGAAGMAVGSFLGFSQSPPRDSKFSFATSPFVRPQVFWSAKPASPVGRC